MKVNDTLRGRLAAIKLVVFDVDGVLTSGEIIYTDEGAELKTFDVKDGLGLRVASDAGLHLVLMTGRSSRVVERRARDLHISDVLQRVGDKEEALRQLAAEKQLSLESIAFMGDDLNDRAAIRMAGVSIAPADAAPEIKEIVDLITDAPGGRGAAREAVEAILKAQGRWEKAVESYLKNLSIRAGQGRGG